MRPERTPTASELENARSTTDVLTTKEMKSGVRTACDFGVFLARFSAEEQFLRHVTQKSLRYWQVPASRAACDLRDSSLHIRN